MILGFALLAVRAASAQGNEYFVYAGTYTGFKNMRHNKPQGLGESHSKGIYVARFNSTTGELSEPQLAAEIVNPSFLVIHPNHKFLYAVIEDPYSLGPPLDHASYVSAFAIDPKTGKLRLLNTLPSGGTSTCFISMDKTGNFIMMAHFGNGMISLIRVKPDGSLGEQTTSMQHLGHSVDPAIQNMPHPHSILPSPDNRFVVVSDLGQDKIFTYKLDAKTGLLSPAEPPFATVQPGGGPRHFTFDPAGKFGYQLGEMSGALDVFSWDAAAGKLNPVQRLSTVTKGWNGDNHSAEIEISADGKFLYESNRRRNPAGLPGPDTIGVFAIAPGKGTLTQVQELVTPGIMPRTFAIAPGGKFVLIGHEITNTVVVYKRDANTGKLDPTGKSVKIDTPVCLKFVPIAP
jgi:6-phosphogluconolactonase